MKKIKGYYYEVTPGQVAAHKKRTLKEIFTWIYETNLFLNSIRTPEEKILADKIRKGEL